MVVVLDIIALYGVDLGDGIADGILVLTTGIILGVGTAGDGITGDGGMVILDLTILFGVLLIMVILEEP